MMNKMLCDGIRSAVTGIWKTRQGLLATILALCLCILCHGNAVGKTLKIGADRWPPYDDINNARSPGYSIEVVKEVFNIMGKDVKFEEYPWRRALQNVFDGKTDALSSALADEDRQKYCHFPEEPLLNSKYVLFIRSEDAGRLRFDAYEDLAGKQIGVVLGTSFPEEFWEVVKRQNTCQEVTIEEQNFKKLVAKRVEYVAAEHGNGIVLIRELGLEGQVLPLLSKSLREDNLYLIFSKKTTTPEFVTRFSDTLRAFKQTEAYWTIYKKYFEIHQK